MANTIPHQPIIFDYEDDCLLASDDLNLLAQDGDITQFQMELQPCGSDFELIQNGNFADSSAWTLFGSGWSISSGQAEHAIGAAGQLVQDAPTSIGTVVRLTFDFVNTDESQTVNVGFTGVNRYISRSGSYEFWYVEDGTGTGQIVFTAGGATACSISNVQMITVNTNFNVAIIENGIPVSNVPSSSYDFSDGYFTCSIDWDSLALPDGCYQLAVVDPCPCSQRGVTALDFTSSTFEWSTSTSWTIGSGTATYNGNSTELTSLLNVICSGLTYEVTFTVSGMGSGEEFSVGLGSTYGTTVTANGTYTQTITANGSRIALRGNSTSGTQTFDVTDFEIEEVIPSDILISNLIEYKSSWSCETKALSICNDSDGLGFGFANTGFKPLMRIPASLNRSSYPMERLSYDNSRGRKYTYYGRLRKNQELGFDGKEFMHDFAALFGLADHFYIDDVEYFVNEDEYPSIAWGEWDDVGGVTINVGKKVQLVENRRLTSSSVGCSEESQQITDEAGEPISDQEDSIITAS